MQWPLVGVGLAAAVCGLLPWQGSACALGSGPAKAGAPVRVPASDSGRDVSTLLAKSIQSHKQPAPAVLVQDVGRTTVFGVAGILLDPARNRVILVATNQGGSESQAACSAVMEDLSALDFRSSGPAPPAP